ncbi:MAG TPA: hypothetical protein VJP86_10260, partial [Vicinamibacterales bacterium]|nr:hypothetical protein [Vicinamibacterales bacterium]
MVTDPPDLTAVRGYERLGRFTLFTAGVSAAIVAIVFPARRLLVAYALYAIPAHLLISFLPNEPMLLYVAKSSAPASVATAGTLGAIAAAILDFWLIGWFVNSGLVRSKLDGSRIYRVASRIFLKAPFLLIAGSALAPVPFYPVKILAIASGYSLL